MQMSLVRSLSNNCDLLSLLFALMNFTRDTTVNNWSQERRVLAKLPPLSNSTTPTTAANIIHHCPFVQPMLSTGLRNQIGQFISTHGANEWVSGQLSRINKRWTTFAKIWGCNHHLKPHLCDFGHLHIIPIEVGLSYKFDIYKSFLCN